MPKQQQRRRRKRYEPGSAYAGDVRPTGFLGFLGSTRMIQVIFIVMALALAAGGIVGVLSRNRSASSNADPDFPAFPTGEGGTPTATAEPADDEDGRSYTGPPPMDIDVTKEYTATIQTDHGDIQVELFADQSPETVNNFVFLAGKGFYDGLTFHYVEQGFSANAGDPNCTPDNDTCRGDGGPGYDLEEDAAGTFQKGTLGMINGSQFLISLTDSGPIADTFAEETTPLGQVISGLDLLDLLVPGDIINAITIREQ